MKPIAALILVFVLAFSAVTGASAQSPESIWITSNITDYKTGETVIVFINAVSATPIQGFTFQIRYDPACLKPVNASSSIQGMNGLGVPQTVGLVDASFASTTPKTANGVLAEVRFETLGGCQTNLTLESAALAIRNEQGFAARLPGVQIGASNIPLNIDSAKGESQPQVLAGTPLPLDPGTSPPDSNSSTLIFALLAILLVAVLGFGIYRVIDRMGPSSKIDVSPSRSAVVQFRNGSYAGKSYSLTKLPCLIGRDPGSDICLNDPFVNNQHVRIYADGKGYHLMDLGGETFINGREIKRSSVVLNPGDVVRLGKRTAFVFAA